MTQSIPPPEVAFDRYLRDCSRYKRGKQDLDLLKQSEVRSVLAATQAALNEALLNETRNIPEHVNHPPFHLDYIDSDETNAHAFGDDDYSFIGLTMGLIYRLWDLCVRLTSSAAVTTLLGIELTPDVSDRLHLTLFLNLLTFVVSHEFAHIVHGHVERRGAESFSFSEIRDEGEIGDLAQQTMEADADGYAVYHVLANVIGGGWRTQELMALKLSDKTAACQDEVLFSCIVVAVGAYLFARPPLDVDKANIYKLTHPPQAARLNYLMEHAIGWCKQNRPALVIWMTKDRLQSIMNAAAEATWGMNGGLTWDAQIAFLRSDAGTEYVRKLGESLKA